MSEELTAGDQPGYAHSHGEAPGSEDGGAPRENATYYEALHLHPAAPAELVSAAYWKLVGEEHDRRKADASAGRRIHELTQLYQVLANAESRAEYNLSLGLPEEAPPQVLETRRWPLRLFGRKAVRGGPGEDPDFYQVLRINPSAPFALIDEAYAIVRPRYVRLVLDGVQPPELLDLIDESHAVLSDPEERGIYDAWRGKLAKADEQVQAVVPIVAKVSEENEASRIGGGLRIARSHSAALAAALAASQGRLAQGANRATGTVVAGIRQTIGAVQAEPRQYALTAAALVAVLALAAIVRMWHLGAIGLRGDEAVYAGQAGVIAGSDALDRYFILVSRGTSNFLLFQYILAAYYAVFGVSDVGARTVAAVLSVLTVGATFELGRMLYGRGVALLGAFLLAMSSYSVALGRLALLDSTMVFFFVLALLFVVRWQRTQNQVWLYAFAGAAALAMEAKVVAVLVIPVALLFLVSSGQLTRLDRRTVVIACVTFFLFMTPALWQLATNAERFSEFLSQSGGRASRVPWYYYISILTRYEGYLIPVIWAAGAAALAVRVVSRRSPEDLLCLIWIAVVGGFFQLYPLKAFNYLLPLIPVLSLVAARALLSIPFQRIGYARVAIVAVALFGASFAPLKTVITDDRYVGLREASYWLAENTPEDAGVMTISRGSAQYVVSYYGQRDAYPFGRFRLATVLPGGAVIDPQPVTNRQPDDWVTYWPERLIGDKTVSYLVFYTDAGDDPPDDPIIQTRTQREFRELIETYDGRLLHTVYHDHEPRVWIYQVGKLLDKPRVSFVAEGSQMKITGEGFHIGSNVALSYHKVALETVPTDGDGSFSVSLSQPEQVRPTYYLTALDEAGNYASSTIKGQTNEDTSPSPENIHLGGGALGFP